MQTNTGVRLQTIPTVETSKYLIQRKEIWTEIPPYKHLNARLKNELLSTESIRTFLKSLLIQRNIIIQEATALVKESWSTVS